jgi:hypothetical protein
MGTTFRIFLPVIEAGREAASRMEQEEAVIGGTETILLAEDDEMVRNLTRRSTVIRLSRLLTVRMR